MFAIVDALPDAAVILDGSLFLRHGNRLARDIFGGLRVGEHIALTSRDPGLTQAVKTVMQSGERQTFNLDVRAPVERHLEGSVFVLPRNSTALDPPMLLVILQDHSERDSLARMRMEFVANASHELRTPLAALSGFVETLRGPARDDPAARDRFLAIMAEQAQRMSRLIDDLLHLSRVEMRAHLAPTAQADLNLVAADAVKQSSTVAAKDNTALLLEALAGEARILGDHDELVQAVQNLVHNALKYGRTGGRVVVRVVRAPGRRGGDREYRVSVVDDGPGIAPEHVPRLTERFYRVSTAASREKDGTGLGLAIVKHIVSRHRGWIDIQSEIGKGSTFTLAFPAAGE